MSVKADLEAALQDIRILKQEISIGDSGQAAPILERISAHTSAARQTTEDPFWQLSKSIPFIGRNISAVTEMAVSADEIVGRAALPLLGAVAELDVDALAPKDGVLDVSSLDEVSPILTLAANTVQLSYDRMIGIDDDLLLPQISRPIAETRDQLNQLRILMNSAAAAGELLPAMVGKDERRSYLLLIQNSAEVRATGGIPGALALLTSDGGRITLTNQDSATGMGVFGPAVKVDPQQEALYTTRLGTHMQNVNLTPHFPTAAETAKQMWEQRYPHQPVDGVIALDTMVLAHLLEATGPVDLTDPHVLRLIEGTSMPSSLTKDNVVSTLLSDVYREIEDPAAQDVYFAAVAERVFTAFTAGQGESRRLFQALTAGAEEHRLYVWSNRPAEQDIIASTGLAGSVEGPAAGGATFGLYYNDGTGAKMDYYAERTVQLVQACPVDGYNNYTVRMTVTNNAPLDAASSLPNYVTGRGLFGVDPGRIRTNYVVYGPSQSFVETAFINGEAVSLGAGRHGQRPVGTVTLELGPGETAVLDVAFSRVVQDSEPRLLVTPTIASPENVILPLIRETECGSG